jgi:hypothetical protein
MHERLLYYHPYSSRIAHATMLSVIVQLVEAPHRWFSECNVFPLSMRMEPWLT